MKGDVVCFIHTNFQDDCFHSLSMADEMMQDMFLLCRSISKFRHSGGCEPMTLVKPCFLSRTKCNRDKWMVDC